MFLYKDTHDTYIYSYRITSIYIYIDKFQFVILFLSGHSPPLQIKKTLAVVLYYTVLIRTW